MVSEADADAEVKCECVVGIVVYISGVYYRAKLL